MSSQNRRIVLGLRGLSKQKQESQFFPSSAFRNFKNILFNFMHFIAGLSFNIKTTVSIGSSAKSREPQIKIKYYQEPEIPES